MDKKTKIASHITKNDFLQISTKSLWILSAFIWFILLGIFTNYLFDSILPDNKLTVTIFNLTTYLFGGILIFIGLMTNKNQTFKNITNSVFGAIIGIVIGAYILLSVSSLIYGL